jgi:hypothetical protein
MLKVSTGLRNYIADTGSLKGALNLSKIRILTGTPPATADAAETGTLLSVITVNDTGTGVTLGVAAGGAIPKNAGEVWKGTNLAGGTATYFRWVAAGDTGVLSTTEKRLQGTCGTSGADLNMSSVNLTALAPQTIDAANITVPTY